MSRFCVNGGRTLRNGIGSCFELFEMFFEVKNFKQTIQNSF